MPAAIPLRTCGDCLVLATRSSAESDTREWRARHGVELFAADMRTLNTFRSMAADLLVDFKTSKEIQR